MIRSLRQRHRLIVSTLSVVIPTAFVLGLAGRKSIPVMPTTPASLKGESQSISQVLWQRSDLWVNHPITVRLTSFSLELWSTGTLAHPDLLVYWLPDGVKAAQRLPDEAYFLGAFRPECTQLTPLPAARIKKEGRLILYSLADQEIVAVSKPFMIATNPLPITTAPLTRQSVTASLPNP